MANRRWPCVRDVVTITLDSAEVIYDMVEQIQKFGMEEMVANETSNPVINSVMLRTAIDELRRAKRVPREEGEIEDCLEEALAAISGEDFEDSCKLCGCKNERTGKFCKTCPCYNIRDLLVEMRRRII